MWNGERIRNSCGRPISGPEAKNHLERSAQVLREWNPQLKNENHSHTRFHLIINDDGPSYRIMAPEDVRAIGRTQYTRSAAVLLLKNLIESKGSISSLRKSILRKTPPALQSLVPSFQESWSALATELVEALKPATEEATEKALEDGSLISIEIDSSYKATIGLLGQNKRTKKRASEGGVDVVMSPESEIHALTSIRT